LLQELTVNGVIQAQKMIFTIFCFFFSAVLAFFSAIFLFLSASLAFFSASALHLVLFVGLLFSSVQRVEQEPEERLKKVHRAEGGANMFAVFRVKNHDLTLSMVGCSFLILRLRPPLNLVAMI
jgi:membrane protein implicated in regulation of membrane protease activity